MSNNSNTKKNIIIKENVGTPVNNPTVLTNLNTNISPNNNTTGVIKIVTTSKPDKKPEIKPETMYNSASLITFEESLDDLGQLHEYVKEFFGSSSHEEIIRQYESMVNDIEAIEKIDQSLRSENRKLVRSIKDRNQISKQDDFDLQGLSSQRQYNNTITLSQTLSKNLKLLNKDDLAAKFQTIANSIKFLDYLNDNKILSERIITIDPDKLILAIYQISVSQGSQSKSINIVTFDDNQIKKSFEQFILSSKVEIISDLSPQIKTRLDMVLADIVPIINQFVRGENFQGKAQELLNSFVEEYKKNLTQISKDPSKPSNSQLLREASLDSKLKDVIVGKMSRDYIKTHVDNLRSEKVISTTIKEHETALLNLLYIITEMRGAIDQLQVGRPEELQRKFAVFLYNRLSPSKIQSLEEDQIVSSLMKPVYEHAESKFSEAIQSLQSRLSSEFLKFLKEAPILKQKIDKASDLKGISKDIIYYSKDKDLSNQIKLRYALSTSNSISKTRFVYTHEGLSIVTASIVALRLVISKDLLDGLESWRSILSEKMKVEIGKKDYEVEDYVILYIIKMATSSQEIESRTSIDIGVDSMKYLFNA